MHQAFLSLCSNLGNRLENLEKAVGLLGNRIGLVRAVSPVYETEPWGCMHEVNFYNLAVSLETRLGPHDLLEGLHEIEKLCGRNDSQVHNAPRMMDIDILFYDSCIIDSENLVIPHPFLHLRKFVLVPLADIAPGYLHPSFNIPVSQLLSQCCDNKTTLKVG
jgi:2-amino-4-hydroxy-6-hydroxymethyldihydropteridine diphosphokinase